MELNTEDIDFAKGFDSVSFIEYMSNPDKHSKKYLCDDVIELCAFCHSELINDESVYCDGCLEDLR